MPRPGATMRNIERWAWAASATLVLGAVALVGPAPALAQATTPNGSVHLGLSPTTSDPHTPSVLPLSSGPTTIATDNCARCHRPHTSQAPRLLTTAGSESALCLTCHDGTGASIDVSSQFAQANTQNNAATGSYYRHDATTPSNHGLSVTDEFSGVLNRHAECGDCHNPHQSHGSNAAQPSGNGWTPSYRLAGISGVSVTNGAAGTAPAYTFQAGVADPIHYEYELCFKCHSSHTILLSNDPLRPSQDMLDAGAEFNPANNSFHPVEAAGKNQTTAMANSLAGGSLWKFSTTATIRCENCHANGSSYASGLGAAADLAPHVSAYRGILLRNYEDRTLPAVDAPYDSTSFTLCYLCHDESPFKPGTTWDAATNFGTGTQNLHRLHVSGLSGLTWAGKPAVAGNGPGATGFIDTTADGGGNALCAECHFRPHSTVLATGTQAKNTARLVSFSPNVLGPDGTTSTPPVWTQSANGGTCSLTCHGFQHAAEAYP